MVHLTSATLLSIAVLAIGSVASPERRADKVITLDDIKNASPVVPTVTDPSKEALSGGGSNSTFLDARPDLANKVDQAAKTLPSLLADDSTPNPKMVRRTLEKRAKETCEIFTNPKDPGVQATSAALALAAQKACEDWFPGPVLYAVPEGSSRTATFFNALTLEYHVRDTSCSPYKAPIHEYYVVSQAICVAQFTTLFTLADTLCAGDHTGVSGKKDTSVPIWYAWHTFE